MILLGIFLVELIALFVFSQELTKALFRFFLMITKSQHTTIQLLAFLFLPGVILHETAHFVVANLLFVQTGEIEFFPQVQGDTVKLGSVAIARTDPFRRFLIGVAPLVFGLGLLLALFYFFAESFPGINWQTAFLLYASFEIGNTMFSSKKDMEGSAVLLLGLAFFFLAFWVLGLKISLDFLYVFLNSEAVVIFLQKSIVIVGIPLLVNLIFLGLFSVFFRKSYH